MNPQEPVIPDPSPPAQDPADAVNDPPDPNKPDGYSARNRDEKLDAYDEADADSFPASDPPAASEPGVP